MTGIGSLPANNSSAFIWATGMNDAGHVVGNLNLNGSSNAYVYSEGSVKNLPFNLAFDINNTGQMTGDLIHNGLYQAALYSNGNVFNLGTLGGEYSTGMSINDSGQVVGTSRVSASNFDTHAFLYDAGTMNDLNNFLPPSVSGWTLASAEGINNRGQIIGSALNAKGEYKAYILTPVPIPGALWLFGSGLLALAGWRKFTAS